MSVNKAVFDFLVQQDNLAVAMEMSEYVEQLQLDMHKRFWSTYNVYMDQKIKGNKDASLWKFSPYQTRRIRKDWEKSRIVFNSPNNNNQSHLQLVFAQSNKESNYCLYWGVCWNKPPEKFNSPALTTLAAELVSRNITITEPPKWIYWGNYKYKIYEADFLIRCYLQIDELIEEIVGDVWTLFSDLRPLMEKINNEVYTTTKSGTF